MDLWTNHQLLGTGTSWMDVSKLRQVEEVMVTVTASEGEKGLNFEKKGWFIQV